MDTSGHGINVSQLAFPDDKHLPAGSLEIRNVACVPLDVAGELRVPVVLPRSRQGGGAATWVGMLVPEAAMHEDYLTAPGKGEIRPPRQILAVQAESIAEPMREAPDLDLRLGVRAADRNHRAPPALGHAFERHQPTFLRRPGHVMRPSGFTKCYRARIRSGGLRIYSAAISSTIQLCSKA